MRMAHDPARRAARERALAELLVRFIAGQCAPADVLPIAREAGFPSFADLCSAVLPDRLPRVRLEREVIARRVDAAIAGDLPLADLRSWADDLHAIAFRHALGSDRHERRLSGEALALLSVAADDTIFKTRGPVVQVLGIVARELRQRRALEAPELYARLFTGQEAIHLATRQPLVSARLSREEDEGEPQPVDEDASWADIVARAQPGKATASDPSAVVAFAAVTEDAVRTDGPGTSTPVNGLIAKVRQAAPNFALARYRPRFQRDVDGILEFVLRTKEIDRPAVLYATKLFALVHEVGRVTLDGESVSTISVR
jgi:hypothetical protein